MEWNGNVERGRYLGTGSASPLRGGGVHGTRHVQDADCQSHNTDLTPAMVMSGYH